MAEFFGKGISVGSGFDLGANLPLDNRTVQATLADRDSMPTIQLVEGLFVYVKENKTAYILKGFDPDGSNRVWETLATGTVDLSGYYTKTQVDDAISTAKTELEAADTALEGQITTVTNQLNNKVDKVAGSSLISDTDLNQIRTNKSDIESLQTSVGGKQDELTPGNAVSITEENVIDVKLDPASNEALSKSAEGLKLDLSGVKGSTVKVGVAITGGAEIGADQTVAEGMKALSDSIKTAVAGGITSITSPDNTIKVTGEGTSRGLAVDMSKLVSTSSSIQIGTDGKLDIFWSEIE